MAAAIRLRVRASTLVGVASLLLWGASMSHGVIRYLDGDPRALLRLGSDFLHPAALQGTPIYSVDGYDGQFFAVLATDPLLLRPETPRMLDSPRYRAGRIGLPLVAWLLAAGNDRRAIALYQLLCWALAALGPWIVARWLEDEGQSPWWAAPLALSAGVASSMYSSLPDAAACTLVVLTLWLHRSRRLAAVPVLALACLVRETGLIAAAAIAIEEVRHRRLGRAALHALVPLAPILGWRWWVGTRPGFGGASLAGEAFGVPFAWVAEKLTTPIDGLEAIALTGLALSFAGVLLLPRALRDWTPSETTYVGFVAMGLFLSRLVYVPIWWNYARVLLLLPMLGIVLAARATDGVRRWTLRAAALSWSGIGAVMLQGWAAGFAVVLAAAWAVHRRASAGALARSQVPLA